MRYDAVGGNDSGPNIYDGNFAMISNFANVIEWYCDVNENSCTPAVVDTSESVFIDSGVEDESLNNIHTDDNKSNDGDSHYGSDSSSRGSCINIPNTSNTQQTTDEAPNCLEELNQTQENEQRMR